MGCIAYMISASNLYKIFQPDSPGITPPKIKIISLNLFPLFLINFKKKLFIYKIYNEFEKK